MSGSQSGRGPDTGAAKFRSPSFSSRTDANTSLGRETLPNYNRFKLIKRLQSLIQMSEIFYPV